MRNYREATISNVMMVELLRKAGLDMPEDCVLLYVEMKPGDFANGVARYLFESAEFDELPEGNEPTPWDLET